ncbi:uncharacterized protein B0T23DRAFT_400686 [Neurospora hispaniola]|uniref:Uncharacterized protein n=1 Tax=Neurospora hispaniola TaxID=588809 RepID=A0AAJ0MUR7_9PEZI|nr:hypothetical protein B0T23DRAFT_400686 [Neurospora hispaniola]
MASWRNGSAFDSRSKGYPFKSGWGHLVFLLTAHNVLCSELRKFQVISFLGSAHGVCVRPARPAKNVDIKTDRSVF